MASEGEAELKTDEIWFSRESLVKRKTKLDQYVRILLDIFHTEDIPNHQGWVKVCIKDILKELEISDSITEETLQSVLGKISKIISSKKVHMSIKERRTGRLLRKNSTSSSLKNILINLDEMVQSVADRRLTPKKLFEFLYLENSNRNMHNVSYSPSNGEYTIYDRLYTAFCKKGTELNYRKKEKHIDLSGFQD